MIDSIHQSSLNMALRCGEAFRRRYIEGEIIPPGIAAGRGTGVHKANEANLKQKIVTRQDISIADMKDAARDGYVKAFEYGVFLPQEELASKNRLLNEGLNDCISLTELYGKQVAPSIRPVAVEQEFNIDVGIALPLAGRIDYQEKPIVGDLKTTKKSWSEGQIEKEIQPVFYSYVHEKLRGIRPEFVYHILVATKQAHLQEQRLTLTDKHYRALFKKLAMFMRMLETGTFLPANPTSWWCARKWCGFFTSCPYMP
jgi:PD-(D/E)XK nuclease superfamily